MPLIQAHSNGKEFWPRLLKDSENLNKEAFYPNGISPSFNWEDLFKNFFSAFHTDSALREAVKMRLFINSEKRPDLISLLADRPPKDQQSLEAWGETLFSGAPWCIVLDKVSGCLDELTAEVATWMGPYLETLESGSFSTDISPYVGRYGYTPFGAHIDIDGISILHLHMGPGTKEMTIWPANTFKELSGSDALNCYDFEPYLPKGKTYSLTAGDIFHLPASTHYHIAYTEDFSVGITLGLRHESAQSMLMKATKTYQKDPHKSDPKTALEQFKWKRKSNCGFMKSPFIKTVDPKTLEGRDFTIAKPFPIVLGAASDGQLMAFARGRRLPSYINSQQQNLIERLNAGAIVTASEVAADDIIQQTISQLYSLKALSLHQE